MDRVRRILEDDGVRVHGFNRVVKNDIGGVEIDVALTVPADD